MTGKEDGLRVGTAPSPWKDGARAHLPSVVSKSPGDSHRPELHVCGALLAARPTDTAGTGQAWLGVCEHDRVCEHGSVRVSVTVAVSGRATVSACESEWGWLATSTLGVPRVCVWLPHTLSSHLTQQLFSPLLG